MATMVCLATGCEDTSVVAPPAAGILRIITTTIGADLDPDGYMLQVGGVPARAVAANGAPEVFQFAPGSYQVVLTGLAANCGLTGVQPTVAVTSGITTEVPLVVSCTALPGTVRVSVSTNGEDPDLGGYLVLVDGVASGRIPPNGTLVLDPVSAGARVIRLDELASNCAVVGPTSVGVTVEHAAVAVAAFALNCQHTAKIAYASVGAVYTMNQDGTGVFTVSPPGLMASGGVWSPDGRQLAIKRYNGDTIYVLDADGSNLRRLGNFGMKTSDPAWSPDGQRFAIMFRPSVDSSYISTCNLSGGDLRQLTTGAFRDQQPAWSPDGTRIAFVRETYSTSVRRLFIVNTDGTGLVQLTDGGPGGNDQEPAWAPDGSLIAFTGQGPTGERRVYLIHPDGTGRESLLSTSLRTWGYRPNWMGSSAQILASGGDRLYAVSLLTRQELWSIPIGIPLVGVSEFSWRP
jgi:sugar lactone lactonase YvrE